MSNPVFGRTPEFNGTRAATNAYGVTTAPSSTVDAQTLETMYGAPSATPRDTGRLTYDDVIMKTASLFAVIAVVGALTWTLAPGLWFVGMIVGLVFGLINAFRREPSPALIVTYAVFQGVFLGGISALFETMWPGVVVQAVLATGATFVACLVLFRSGKIRVTPKFRRWLFVAIGGYLVFALTNFVLSFFMPGDGFGPMRAGWVGVAVGVLAVGLASAALIVDFDAIKRGVEGGVAKKFAWTAAFGLVVTLVWLYIEFLRLLAILRN